MSTRPHRARIPRSGAPSSDRRTTRLVATALLSGATALAPAAAAPAGRPTAVPPTIVPAPAAAAPVTYFPDMLYGQTFHTDVMWLASRGITTGYPDGTFRPRRAITRGEMAAFLYRLAGSPAYNPPAVSPFRDVATTHAFYPAISWLASKRVTTGWADGTFRPNASTTREQMAAFLYRLAGSPAYPRPTTARFRDVPVTSGFSREIAWLAARGITTGWADGTFRPTQPVTREQMAAFLHRYAGGPAFTPAQDNRPAVIKELPAWQWADIVAAGVWRPGACPGGRTTYVRVEVPFYGQDGRYHRGAIVVNRDVSRDTAAAFNHFAAARFPVAKVIPVEYYGGWDKVSEAANNTSGWNCRKPSESISNLYASPHANGRAIDVNPVQNPWIRPGTSVWEPSSGTVWASRRSLAWQRYGVIVPGTVPYAWFTAHGWVWQDSSTPDYMHFDTGFPSRYRAGH